MLNWLSQLPPPTETSVEPFSFSFLFCLIPRSFVDVVSFRVCNPNNTMDSGRERSGSLCFSVSGGLVMAADFQWTKILRFNSAQLKEPHLIKLFILKEQTQR